VAQAAPQTVPAAPSAPAAAAASAPAPAPAPAQRTHVVVDGDTLTRISVEYYGTSRRWQDIFDANRGTLSSPGALSIGATLVIP
jgi:nucleoid-associated protein YgaU